MNGRARRGPLVSAGALLGAGLGGFVDGILFHQILQWHNLLSARVPPLDPVTIKYNMVWDGFFHAFTWLMTVVGLLVLWRCTGDRRVPHSTKSFGGALLLGWGLFNLVEGTIDHHLLGLHHVRPGAGQAAWDVGFLILGAVLCAAGWLLIRSGRHDQPRDPRPSRPWEPEPPRTEHRVH